MSDRFYVETHQISNGPGIMNSLRVSVFLESSATGRSKVGEYVRNHAELYDTFCPFQQHGKWYALYSSDYTATRVMELPRGVRVMTLNKRLQPSSETLARLKRGVK